jgi:predicted transport protein
MALSGDEMMDAVTKTMKDKTGRSRDEWVALVDRSGVDPLDQKAVRAWLKTEHQLTQPLQWAISLEAARQAGWVEPTLADQVNGQYSGKKEALRPIFDKLDEAIEKLGQDVDRMAGSNYVAFTRGRQFAAVTPATASRVDLGLRFTDAPGSARISASKGPGQSTHKIPLTSAEDVDAEVVAMLRDAYAQNA